MALQPKDKLAAQLLQQLQHKEQPAARQRPRGAPSPAEPPRRPSRPTAAPSGKEGNSKGTWTAQPAEDTTITVTFQDQDHFTWKVAHQGKDQQFQGNSSYENGILTLAQDQKQRDGRQRGLEGRRPFPVQGPGRRAERPGPDVHQNVVTRAACGIDNREAEPADRHDPTIEALHASAGESDASTRVAVEGGDRNLVIRGGGNCRSWNNIQYKVGLSAKNVGSRKLSMNVATIPPGGVAYAHIHVGFELMLYILQGRVRHEYGPGLTQSIENEAGDFIYIEPGVPHEVFNLSQTEPVVAVVARSDASEWENIVPYDRASASRRDENARSVIDEEGMADGCDDAMVPSSPSLPSGDCSACSNSRHRGKRGVLVVAFEATDDARHRLAVHPARLALQAGRVASRSAVRHRPERSQLSGQLRDRLSGDPQAADRPQAGQGRVLRGLALTSWTSSGR